MRGSVLKKGDRWYVKGPSSTPTWSPAAGRRPLAAKWHWGLPHRAVLIARLGSGTVALAKIDPLLKPAR